MEKLQLFSSDLWGEDFYALDEYLRACNAYEKPGFSENPLKFFDGTIIVTILAIKMSARCIQKLIKLAFEIMAQATMTVRTDSKVKTEFTNLCEQFGMSANTAMNIFYACSDGKP